MLGPVTRRQMLRWASAILATVCGAVLTVAATEACGLFGRVTTLEADSKSSHELLLEVRQDVKELLRR